ncbi:hypothetical protein CDG76_34505 [Nostoc sp. 'Peltigera membranacea cyanobiont' 210A]|nr:hypothetical protein CDG76_34505 [Nostoc sp. 'Peltigera membranacea cyanobiont' 210A]
MGKSNVILEIQLVSDFKMLMVEVWLGLLLGGFTLEQHSNFYHNQNAWVKSSETTTGDILGR